MPREPRRTTAGRRTTDVVVLARLGRRGTSPTHRASRRRGADHERTTQQRRSGGQDGQRPPPPQAAARYGEDADQWPKQRIADEIGVAGERPQPPPAWRSPAAGELPAWSASVACRSCSKPGSWSAGARWRVDDDGGRRVHRPTQPDDQSRRARTRREGGQGPVVAARHQHDLVVTDRRRTPRPDRPGQRVMTPGGSAAPWQQRPV